MAATNIARYEVGTFPFWTPLRFPGQYYDTESDHCKQEVTWASWQIATLTSGGPRREVRNGRFGCVGKSYSQTRPRRAKP